tara:strand:- start:2106 stop:3251 length:1146 start_codon:yes stop_codon:yes gene_type:complete
MDVTNQIQQNVLAYSASDNTNANQLVSSKRLNYAEGATLQKPEVANLTAIPFTLSYSDTVGLFGVENYFLKVNAAIDGEIVLACFVEEGWNCAFVEGVTPTTGTTVTYYAPTSPNNPNSQRPIDANEYRIDDAQGNAVSSTNTIDAGDLVTVNLNQITYTGVFQPTTPPNFTFQWVYRGTVGEGYPVGTADTPITGATSQSFTVPVDGGGLVGKHLNCRVTYDSVNPGGNIGQVTSLVQNNGVYAFVATGPVNAGTSYENAAFYPDLSSDETGWSGSEFLQDTLPKFEEDAYYSVVLTRKDTGNIYNDKHIDYRLYTKDGREHPYDRMFIKANDHFYIGVHARNTRSLTYGFDCTIGTEFRALSAIENKDEIMHSDERQSF